MRQLFNIMAAASRDLSYAFDYALDACERYVSRLEYKWSGREKRDREAGRALIEGNANKIRWQATLRKMGGRPRR